jgi:hypothetical protein
LSAENGSTAASIGEGIVDGKDCREFGTELRWEDEQ